MQIIVKSSDRMVYDTKLIHIYVFLLEKNWKGIWRTYGCSRKKMLMFDAQMFVSLWILTFESYKINWIKKL